MAGSSSGLVESSPGLGVKRDADGCLLAEQLVLPVIDDLSVRSASLLASLESLALAPRNKKKMGREQLQSVITTLCDGRFLTLQCLASFVNRKPEALRNEYMTKRVRDRSLPSPFRRHRRMNAKCTVRRPPYRRRRNLRQPTVRSSEAAPGHRFSSAPMNVKNRGWGR